MILKRFAANLRVRTGASKSIIDKDLGDSGTIEFCRAHGIALGKVRPAIAANAD